MGSGDTNQDYAGEQIAMIVKAAIADAMDRHNEQHRQLLESNNNISNQLTLAAERLNRVTALTEQHEILLKGNGKVGLVTRIEQIEAAVQTVSDTVKETRQTVTEIEGALRGEKDKTGIVGRVSEIERRLESMAKPVWIIISAVLSVLVTYLITFFAK